MLFYQFSAYNSDEQWVAENDDRRTLHERIRKIAKHTRMFNRTMQNKAYYFVFDASESLVQIGAIICDSRINVHIGMHEYLEALGLKVDVYSIELEEVTLGSLAGMLNMADMNDYIRDDDEVLEQFGLDGLGRRGWNGIEYGENVIETAGKDAIYEAVSHYLVHDTFIPELDRIFAGKTGKSGAGHPVHYMIQTDDSETRKTLYGLLLKALYANKRIGSRRYCFLDFKPGENIPKMLYDRLYSICAGGAVIVRYLADDDTEDDRANSSRETIETLCEIMKKYCNQVLTVFCLPRECTKAKSIFYENLGNTSIVELREEFAAGEKACDFLKMLARDAGVRTDKKLFAMASENETYLAPDLHAIFDEWYNNKLRTAIYPQYKEMATARKEAVKKASKGSAYDELSAMIGLTEAKKIIDRAISYYKAQKLFADKGMKADKPAMHMVFTGNPGTAKTTVARLFARIMQENDLLSKGRCVEVGRGDLVGKYVGWTAPTIQAKFREAAGSVLFIDEAYSLVDDRSGSYGDEAINTIVQEMENHREDVVVIFAGYPDKMEQFLQKNPGLRSRIAFHVPFDDYTTDDLCGIARLIAKNKGLTLTEDALDKLKGVFEQARLQEDFGNGRYVRNAIEKARMAQAERLLAMDPDAVSRKAVATICAEDIEMPAAAAVQKKARIGFCA